MNYGLLSFIILSTTTSFLFSITTTSFLFSITWNHFLHLFDFSTTDFFKNNLNYNFSHNAQCHFPFASCIKRIIGTQIPITFYCHIKLKKKIQVIGLN